jgi:type IV pilus assembly protein PilC
MAKFIYTAKSYSGETKGGEMIARDEKSLAQQLRGEGFLVTSVKEIKEKDKGGNKILSVFQFGVPLKEKMMFARNLSVMIASGLTVSKSVKNLSVQTKVRSFKKILLDIYEEVQGGKNLSDGLAKYPAVFSELFTNMVRVGEASGNLDEVLDIVATQLEKEHELKSKLKGAMIYPAVILFVMIAIAFLMLTFILPKMLSVFKDMDVELPIMTKAVIGISDFFAAHSILVLITIVALVFFTRIFMRTGTGKRLISFLVLKIPLINNLVIKVNCARFARIHSSLLRSGISVVESLKIVSHTLTNYYYSLEFKKAVEQIQKGVNLSKVISENHKIFPVLVPQMLEVGEETGKTEAVLLKLAEFYEEEVSQITKNMSSIIEPFLMVIIGAAVGIFAISMLQPMYSMMENIK